mmetsp:Transcript_5886/g.16728  ORF Transcript_5886/g.16728 Transcript_5886/m.16728 type:complete len:360 (+) Transcript_5886:537-1616(+)
MEGLGGVHRVLLVAAAGTWRVGGSMLCLVELLDEAHDAWAGPPARQTQSRQQLHRQRVFDVVKCDLLAPVVFVCLVEGHLCVRHGGHHGHPGAHLTRPCAGEGGHRLAPPTHTTREGLQRFGPSPAPESAEVQEHVEGLAQPLLQHHTHVLLYLVFEGELQAVWVYVWAVRLFGGDDHKGEPQDAAPRAVARLVGQIATDVLELYKGPRCGVPHHSIPLLPLVKVVLSTCHRVVHLHTHPTGGTATRALVTTTTTCCSSSSAGRLRLCRGPCACHRHPGRPGAGGACCCSCSRSRRRCWWWNGWLGGRGQWLGQRGLDHLGDGVGEVAGAVVAVVEDILQQRADELQPRVDGLLRFDGL